MKRYLFTLTCFCLCAIACMPSKIKGRVNTAIYSVLSKNQSFIIFVPDKQFGLTEKRIQKYISEKMIQLGFVPSDDIKEADCIVVYSYKIGAGETTTTVTSSPDFVFGGKNVSSSSHTNYPRYFHIDILDRMASENSNKPIFIWQGEVYSYGSSSDISFLAPFFIDEIFKHFGKDTDNEPFSRVVK